MKNIIFIDACMRAGSRTKRIAERIIEELSGRYCIETIRLGEADYPVVDNRILEERNNGTVPKAHAELAGRIAAADRIVIAAPFWDMSFPSALKVFSKTCRSSASPSTVTTRNVTASARQKRSCT